MKHKYEFVPSDEITIAPGRTVKRIRALVAIPSRGVKPGDLGGYIESEKNLAQVSGNAWVSGNAQVYGDARVSGDAWVPGNARVDAVAVDRSVRCCVQPEERGRNDCCTVC